MWRVVLVLVCFWPARWIAAASEHRRRSDFFLWYRRPTFFFFRNGAHMARRSVGPELGLHHSALTGNPEVGEAK